MRRAARTDANQVALVEALRAVGAEVLILSAVGGGCPDVLVGFRGQLTLLEFKDASKPPSARRLTPAQKLFHERWRERGRLAVVETRDEALRAIGAIR